MGTHFEVGQTVRKANGGYFGDGNLEVEIVDITGNGFLWFSSGTNLRRELACSVLEIVPKAGNRVVSYPTNPCMEIPSPQLNRKLTGGSSDYYKVTVEVPTTPGKDPYEAECNDIIEALDMRFAEANIFKAIWRRAAARLGNGKPGTSDLYDAEKIEFFGNRILAQAQQQDGVS